MSYPTAQRLSISFRIKWWITTGSIVSPFKLPVRISREESFLLAEKHYKFFFRKMIAQVWKLLIRFSVIYHFLEAEPQSLIHFSDLIWVCKVDLCYPINLAIKPHSLQWDPGSVSREHRFLYLNFTGSLDFRNKVNTPPQYKNQGMIGNLVHITSCLHEQLFRSLY